MGAYPWLLRNEIHHHSLFIAGEMGFGNTV